MKKPTISQIKIAVSETQPHFFDAKTLKFFGQTMKSFTVTRLDDGNYLISAPIYYDGRICGYTKRVFVPEFSSNGEYINRGKLISVE